MLSTANKSLIAVCENSKSLIHGFLPLRCDDLEIVTINGSNGSVALVLREDSPEVKGVLVIAEGADDIGVKLSLLNAVKTILNVSLDKVDVYKMNNE